ncbi:MAG TPA: NAD(P)H-binding protein [Ramlibacter sp.]|nr:NAD(P)H-binding protein [Ramlibacter sp.]
MFVLLGSNGQITSQLAHRLLAEGRPVRVIGRNAQALAELQRAGAELALGDPSDAAFLERAFAGAVGVYAMTPPCYTEPDMRAAQGRIGMAVAQALRRARVRRVVNLSSVGAELPAGTGPIASLHAQEKRLDAIDRIDLLHLRPGYFMENFLAGLPSVAAGGPLAGMEAPDVPIPMVATRDISALVARELTSPAQRGVLVLHSPSHPTMREAARTLGAACGNPGLEYLQLPPAEMKPVLQAEGLSADATDQLEELAHWLSTDAMASIAAAPAALQPTTIEHFARQIFAPAYAHAAPAGSRS